MRRSSHAVVVATMMLCAAGEARAVDVPITGLKLIILDKIADDRGRAVFVSKDPAIVKSDGTDGFAMTARLDVAYDGVAGSFLMPSGSNWVVSDPTFAKYSNVLNLGMVQTSVIKEGKLLKVVAKGKDLGFDIIPIDISTAPTGAVYVTHTLVNGEEKTRHCTQFTACLHKTLAGGAGWKLVCRAPSSGDPACLGHTPFCGDGILDAPETCDPTPTCPTQGSCGDMDPCTIDSVMGSEFNCDRVCIHTPRTECQNGDLCCPAGCDALNDDDCSP